MAEPKTSDFDEEDIDVCLQCNNRREKESQAFRSATRKVALLTAICSVLCVLTITACCCSLYIYTRFQGFRQELRTLVRMDPEGADSLLDDHFAMDQKSMPMYGDPADDEEYQDLVEERKNRLRHRRKKEKQSRQTDRRNRQKAEKTGKNKQTCRKKQKKMCNCCKQTLMEYIDKRITSETNKMKEVSQTPSTEQDPAIENNKMSYVSAAHYTTYVNEEFIKNTFGTLEHDFRVKPNTWTEQTDTGSDTDKDMKMEMPEWQGTLYRNRTFVTTAAPLNLRFFKEADWMKNSTALKIFDFDDASGKFKVLHSGLYHLYAHVLFYDVKTRMAIGLIHESKMGMPRVSKVVFRCMQSVDYVNPKLTVGQNSKFKSCNINGVLYLNKGDNVALQSLYNDTCLDLTYDGTYFGGIFISTNNNFSE